MAPGSFQFLDPLLPICFKVVSIVTLESIVELLGAEFLKLKLLAHDYVLKVSETLH